jgi:hypothetical protein
MITAKQALTFTKSIEQIRREELIQELHAIETNIKYACNEGQTFTMYTAKDSIYAELFSELATNGYIVEEYSKMPEINLTRMKISWEK